MKKILLLSLFTISFQFLFSQKFTPGYIVTIKGDTLKGAIHFDRRNESVMKVRLKSSDQEQVFTPSTIRSANNSTTTIYSSVVEMDMSPKGKEIVSDTIFADLMVKGNLSLFLYMDRYKKSHFFLEDESGKWHELVLRVIDQGDGFHFQELALYKGTLKQYFAECPTLFNEIDHTIYAKNNLKKLFIKGLSCKYGQQSIKEVNQEKTQIDFGFIGGLTQTSLQYVDKLHYGYRVGRYNFDKSFGVSVGVYFDLKIPRVNKFVLRNELLFKNSTNTSPDIIESVLVQNQVKSSGYVNTNYLKYNLMVRYFFSHKKLSPFISVGVSPGFLLSHAEYANVTTTAFTTTTYTQEPIMHTISSFESGAVAGLGINSSNFGFEMRYELSNGLQPKEASSSVTSFYVLAYYKFRKLR
jgi:hypothetical protein